MCNKDISVRSEEFDFEAVGESNRENTSWMRFTHWERIKQRTWTPDSFSVLFVPEASYLFSLGWGEIDQN